MRKTEKKVVVELIGNNLWAVTWGAKYLLEAVRAIKPKLGDIEDLVEFREINLDSTEGLKRKDELSLNIFPVVIINGDVLFVNIIPSEDELLEAIHTRLET